MISREARLEICAAIKELTNPAEFPGDVPVDEITINKLIDLWDSFPEDIKLEFKQISPDDLLEVISKSDSMTMEDIFPDGPANPLNVKTLSDAIKSLRITFMSGIVNTMFKYPSSKPASGAKYAIPPEQKKSPEITSKSIKKMLEDMFSDSSEHGFRVHVLSADDLRKLGPEELNETISNMLEMNNEHDDPTLQNISEEGDPELKSGCISNPLEAAVARLFIRTIDAPDEVLLDFISFAHKQEQLNDFHGLGILNLGVMTIGVKRALGKARLRRLRKAIEEFESAEVGCGKGATPKVDNCTCHGDCHNCEDPLDTYDNVLNHKQLKFLRGLEVVMGHEGCSRFLRLCSSPGKDVTPEDYEYLCELSKAFTLMGVGQIDGEQMINSIHRSLQDSI